MSGGDLSPNHLWRNDGDGTFSERAVNMGVAFGEQGNAQAGMGVDSGGGDTPNHRPGSDIVIEPND